MRQENGLGASGEQVRQEPVGQFARVAQGGAAAFDALGVGPEPVKVTKLTARSLAELIIELTSGRYTERAAEVGRRLRAEDGVGRTLATLEEIGLIQPQIRPRS